MKKGTVMFLLMALTCVQAFAQDLPPSIEAILKQTMAADGQLTKSMHQKFWKELHSFDNSKEIAKLTKIWEVYFHHC